MKENFSISEVASILRLSVHDVKRAVKRKLLTTYQLRDWERLGIEPRVTRDDLILFGIFTGTLVIR